jgi:hypothetical protein
MSHIFISHVHENQKMVEQLSQELKNHGMEVWLDHDSILPGARWKDAIRQAIQNGAFFIACFSTEYENRNKNYMNEELILAIDELRQFSIKRTWFIPVLLSECNIPALSIGAGQTLLDFQWVNLSSNWGSGIQKLLRVLRADEIEKIKEDIDELGYRYINRLGHDSVFSPDTVKEIYLKRLHELKETYGVTYDPFKIYHG